MSQIQEFYTGKTIFITGGTGFLGKILIEKLLRSCPDIATVYVLVRAKKGKNSEERIDSLLVDPVFGVLRIEYPDFATKIIGVSGDIGEEGLGLSTTDYERLVSEVSMIFHLAATIRFNETLDRAVNMNVRSTKCIVDIAKACKNLKAGIYVSTAYSNCVRKTIKEEFYPPPFSYERIIQIVEDTQEQQCPGDEMKLLTEKIIGEWPNTYSFSKAIAEGVVAEFAKELPFAVFRPSIVVPAYREPIPGWVDGPMGPAGLFCAAGLGIMHVNLLNDNARCDVVPVDYVSNALISCAWETAITDNRQREDIPVYNYIAGNENPISWKEFTGLAIMYGHAYPSIAAVYYLSIITAPSSRVFSVLEFFLHLLPALIIDSIARLFGKQPGFYKVVRKIGDAVRATGYFSTQQWDFENQRVQNLWNRIGPQDKLIFPFSMRNVDWDEHAMKMARGLWKYLTGQPDGSEEKARRRQFYLYIIHTMVRLTIGILLLWIIWKYLANAA